MPLLFLQKYLSVNAYKQRKRILLWNKSNPKSVLRYKNGVAFNISKNKGSVSKSLIFKRNYEFNETNLIKKVIKTDWTVIDVGANFGWYSMHFAHLVGKNGKIFSFEPVPETYEELNSNIKLNSFQNIKAFNLALGNKDGAISFGVANFDGGSGASSEFLNYSKRIQTNMRKLDDIIKEEKINKVDFIKLDIEGGELNMLKGSEQLLKRFRPKILIEIVDMHCQRFGHSPLDVYNFLINKGYKGLFIGNEYTKEKNNISIKELTKPNASNLLNGNYFFS